MPEENPDVYFRAWGADNIAYGPVELPTLVNWIRDGRVLPETWVYREIEGDWTRARDLKELKLLFKSAETTGRGTSAAAKGITAGALRRIKILADMEDRLLVSLLSYLDQVKMPANTTLFRKGDHADSMFFVLQGEVRARVMVSGKESTLSTMGVGECFGELALLDQGPRSTDVVSNQESVLLKITATSLKRLFDEAPALAAPFLLSLSRAVTARMRGLTKRYEDSINFARTSRG